MAENREQVIGVRVTAAEKLWLQAAAEAERVSVGEFLRRVALLKALELSPPVGQQLH